MGRSFPLSLRQGGFLGSPVACEKSIHPQFSWLPVGSGAENGGEKMEKNFFLFLGVNRNVA
jgi:hypothetical protein